MIKLTRAFSDFLHTDERVNVALNLIQFGYTEEIAITAAKSCTDVPSAVDFLNRSCGICFESFPANQVNIIF